ncbi:MAG: nucleoside monophosphate kinase [Candidatus Pacebacteria bacterium]|nr:nucleoside monophosphate kinase [Candidatus Paceibacterota bacterium]MDR3583585.1 nucleoside monophosphate kinase [Candidatus Paceibacterota bacterium]
MNIVILGPQGSGKGTQAEKMAAKFKLEHIDMGKFLREVAKMDTPLGKEVWQIQNVTKTLVPKRILEEIFTIKLNDISREKGIVFDGFPRNMDQTEYFEHAMREFGRETDAVVYIKLSKEESVKRISKRWVCEKCKSVWIMGKDVKSEEDKCLDCGGKITQRTDDTPEGIEKRLKVFEKETLPVVAYYENKGKIIEIDGAQTIEKVFEDILSNLGVYDS